MGDYTIELEEGGRVLYSRRVADGEGVNADSTLR